MINENPILEKEILNSKIEILRLAHADLLPRWHSPRHLINSNIFYLMQKGEADIWCNDHHHHMTPGNIYVIPAGSFFAAGCRQNFSKLYFYADLRNSDSELLPVGPPEGTVLQGREKQIEEMIRLYGNKDYGSAIRLQTLAVQLVTEAFCQGGQQTDISRRSPMIASVLRIVNNAPHLSLTAEVLAEMVHASVPNLRKKFKNETGVPLGKYVQDNVLRAAAHDLQYSELSLSDISLKYGFYDQFYFSNRFTAHFGISPSKYRKNNIF